MKTPQSKSTKLDELEGILDNHARVYAWATMRFITGKFTEDERDKEWHHSDLRTKKAINAYVESKVLEGRLEELKAFEPFFAGDHRNCLDPKTCVGYENARSDFDNEKQLRLAELETTPTKLKEGKDDGKTN